MISSENLNEKVEEKLKESELFLMAADNYPRKMKKIIKQFTVKDKKKILNANLIDGYTVDSLQDKMNFINLLPYECKIRLMVALIQRAQNEDDAEENKRQ